MISDDKFKEHLLPAIPQEYRGRAQKLFDDFGEAFSEAVVDTLIYIAEKPSLGEDVIKGLSDIYEMHVKNIEPELRAPFVGLIKMEYFSILNGKLNTALKN